MDGKLISAIRINRTGIKIEIPDRLKKMIKGESSWWINKLELTSEHFRWQDEYYAAAVCESRLPQVRRYIRNQERYHSKNSSEKENEEFLRQNGFSNE